MSHTPGPWESVLIGEGGGRGLYEVRGGVHTLGEFVYEDDARLMAAAPDLLAALKALASYTEACEGMLNVTPAGQVTNARAAIAKAETK
jgi:hypothetical protein